MGLILNDSFYSFFQMYFRSIQLTDFFEKKQKKNFLDKALICILLKSFFSFSIELRPKSSNRHSYRLDLLFKWKKQQIFLSFLFLTCLGWGTSCFRISYRKPGDAVISCLRIQVGKWFLRCFFFMQRLKQSRKNVMLNFILTLPYFENSLKQ